jgi:regulator of cell morphogenesis and NO signaling
VSPIPADIPVAELVLERPGRARVFERFGIDYCCGGKIRLDAACAARGLDLAVVTAALEEHLEDGSDDVDWTSASLAELCTHIVEQHHGYLRDELPPLRELVDKVAGVHGNTHAELLGVQEIFHELADELEQHMLKEERIVFPACVALDAGATGRFPFGSVENPIGVMLHEHDEVAAGLAALRALTGAYEPPAGACNSYRAMLERLDTLEQDTHRHVHKENNILFPRAVELETAR